MSSIKEAPTKQRRFERIGTNTHIKDLGLNKHLKAVKVEDGMVGQQKTCVINYAYSWLDLLWSSGM